MKQDESKQLAQPLEAAHTPKWCRAGFFRLLIVDKETNELIAKVYNVSHFKTIAQAPETARKLARLLEMAKKALVVADFTCDGQYPEAGKALEKEFEAAIKACEAAQ